MPNPAPQDVHVNELMTDFAVGYMQSQQDYLATKVFPIISVDKQSDNYIVWDRNDWLRDEAERRADSTESVGSGYRYSTDSYFAHVYAIHKDVGWQSRHNQDKWVNLEQGAIRFVSRKILLRQEIQWATDFFTTGIWTGGVGGTDYTVPATWNDVTSDPIEDFEINVENMLLTTGFRPNTAVFGYKAMRRLAKHPDVKEYIKYTGSAPALVTPAIIGQILNIPRIFVATSVKATNVESETAAYSAVHGNHVWMGYVSPSPSAEDPSAGYTFAWDYAGYGQNVAVDSFDIRQKKTTRYEGEAAWVSKVTAPDLGVFMPNVVT